MSDSSPDAPNGTLYNPPERTDETLPLEDDSVGLQLTLSEDEAERLQAVAQQLGLTPSTIAQRAIRMVCEEVVTIQEDSRSPTLMVEQYQARIDLLHAVEDNGASPTSTDRRDDAGGRSLPENSSPNENPTGP